MGKGSKRHFFTEDTEGPPGFKHPAAPIMTVTCHFILTWMTAKELRKPKLAERQREGRLSAERGSVDWFTNQERIPQKVVKIEVPRYAV